MVLLVLQTSEWGVWAHLFIPVNIFCLDEDVKALFTLHKKRKKTFMDLMFWKSSGGSPWGLRTDWNYECVSSGVYFLQITAIIVQWVGGGLSSSVQGASPVSCGGGMCSPCCWSVKRGTESGAWAFPLESWCSSPQTRVSQGPAASPLPLPSLESQGGCYASLVLAQAHLALDLI